MKILEKQKYSKTKTIFGHNFKNPQLLQSALTHPSICKNNEFQRLEFLGDRILNLEVALMIFNNHKDYTAGQMSLLFSSLICADKIYEITNSYIAPYLVSYGKVTKNVIADTFEAVIGALFLDNGNIKKIIYELWNVYIVSAMKNREEIKEQKTDLILNHNNKSYKNILNLIGGDECNYVHLMIRKDNESYFESKVTLFTFTATGIGKSKKEADENGAKNILEKIYSYSSLQK